MACLHKSSNEILPSALESRLSISPEEKTEMRKFLGRRKTSRPTKITCDVETETLQQEAQGGVQGLRGHSQHRPGDVFRSETPDGFVEPFVVVNHRRSDSSERLPCLMAQLEKFLHRLHPFHQENIFRHAPRGLVQHERLANR